MTIQMNDADLADLVRVLNGIKDAYEVDIDFKDDRPAIRGAVEYQDTPNLYATLLLVRFKTDAGETLAQFVNADDIDTIKVNTF